MELFTREQTFSIQVVPGSIMQTWNLSQAPQACLCKIILVRVKCLAKHVLFLLQFGLVCVQILGVELTKVSLHYK